MVDIREHYVRRPRLMTLYIAATLPVTLCCDVTSCLSMLRRPRFMTLYIAAIQASSVYVATQDTSRCVGSILLRINASLEYISDYLCIQQNPSRDAGISCSLPGWQIEQRLCHINYIL